ncbi:tetratricopeptide repeat protein [Bacillus sp. DNRA2]|uniref:tetratricopeptide repeat protein n=1 Tax=Bacillus sp. DNRA2 TaxID=2723053 RepID=UPI00145DD205|nr:tetratricopeptide repeat protein [Bacillus sp. DNRA2]NMD72617.1 tetratricopeptide repeat protein [Bacillus sp. DNRA2]
MELRPKHPMKSILQKKNNLAATREFTDREMPTQAFVNAFREKKPDEYKVLTYYGVGGIGKSRLMKELYKKLDDLSPTVVKVVKVIIDFKEERNRLAGEALISLREELMKNERIKFHTFDLAYTIYWRKLHPQLSMKSNKTELPFIEEGSFFAELIENLDYVPLAQWVPKTLKLINGFTGYKDSFGKWWRKRGLDVLNQLEDLQPTEIEEMLPAFFSVDVKEYLASTGKTAIFFLDTYEALWEKNRQQGSFNEKDAWIQELVLQLKEVLWVICGREKIQWANDNSAWEPFLEQHLMGELSEKDSDKFLTKCGIANDEIRQLIIKSSRGLPYHLDLMVDTYTLIQETRIPKLGDFSQTPNKILERFLRYLDISEKETIKVLSFARYWDEALFAELVTQFQTGYPPTAYLDLFRFSFFNKNEEEYIWDMNPIMRNNLQEDILKTDPRLYNKIHGFLFKYYDKKLKSAKTGQFSILEKKATREAFYHGMIVKQSAEFLEWFLENGKKLEAEGQFALVYSFYHDVISLLPKEESVQAAAVYQYFGEIGLLQGNYDNAKELYGQALRVYFSKNKDLKGIIKCSIDLAEIMIHTAQYEEAYRYLLEASKYCQEQEAKKQDILLDEALLSVRLGKLNIRFARYEESLENYQVAIRACDQALLLSPEDPAVFAMKALAYEKLGELYGSREYDNQGECYRKSIHFYDLALKNKNQINYLRVLTNQGLAYKRLAEHYDVNKEPAEKLKSFEQAIMIYDHVLGQSPDFIDALEKKGHAAVDYMVLQIQLGQFERAIETFTEAIDAFGRALELSPKQAGSKNRIASAHREIAIMYMKRDQPEEALMSLKEAVRIYEELLQESNYIYVHNSLGKTHETIGDYYTQFADPEKARAHYQQAIQEFQNMLLRSPKLREPLERIEHIKKKLGND